MEYEIYGGLMDYSVFLSGFSLFFLAIVVSRFQGKEIFGISWKWLVSFGILGAIHEFTVLATNLTGDQPYFLAFRYGLLFLSFLMAIEFARRGLSRNGLSIHPLFIHPPVLAVIGATCLLSLEATFAFIRILVISLAVLSITVLLLVSAANSEHNRGRARLAVIPVVLYGLTWVLFSARGCADYLFIFSEEHFNSLFGPGIHSLRALTLFLITAAVWLAAARTRQKTFPARKNLSLVSPVIMAVVLIAALLVAGFRVSLFISDYAKRRSLDSQTRYASSLAGQLQDDFRKISAAIGELSTDRKIISGLKRGTSAGARDVNQLLVRTRNMLQASLTFIADPGGTIRAGSEPVSLIRQKIKTLSATSYFRDAVQGRSGQYFGLNPLSGQRSLFASQPLRESGRTVGVIVLVFNLENWFDSFNPLYINTFLTDPNGIIFLSPRQEYIFSSFWPVTEATRLQLNLTGQFGKHPFSSLFAKKIETGQYIEFEGQHSLASVQPVTESGWSIIVIDSVFQIKLIQLLAIFVVFALTILLFVFFSIIERTRLTTLIVSKSEEQFRAIYAHAPEGILLVDPADYSIVESNDYAVQMMGLSRQMLIHKNLEDLFISGFDEFKEALRELDYDETLSLQDYQLYHSTKQAMYIEGNCARIEFRNKSHLMLFLNDVTDRKLADETIKQNELKYRNLFDNASDAIVLLDRDQILDCNSKAAEMLGVKRFKLIGMSQASFLPDFQPDGKKSIDLLVSHMYDAMDGEPQRFYCQYRRNDQTPFDAEVSLNRVDVQGSLVIQAIIRDVSEQKQIERNLKDARDKALELSRAKSDFLANMSHEIRTPMNGVIGMLELLSGTELTVNQKDYLTTAQNSASSMMNIINDILDFSKIEAGKLEIEKIKFDVRSVIEGVGDSMAKAAFDKGLELINYVDSQVPSYLLGDPGRIRQILMNFAGNAIKFTKSGEVVIGCTVQRQDRGNLWLKFFVKDTGIGIPKDKQKHIFEAFQQVDGTMTRKYGGTGLGLTICRQLIGMMHGNLYLKSEPGKGSMFSFVLPFQDDQTVAKKEMKATRSAGGKKALLIENNASLRFILNKMIQHYGLQIELAADARGALAKWNAAQRRSGGFELIIMDAALPDMNPADFVTQVNRDNMRKPGILLLSSNGQARELEQAGLKNSVSVLKKPVAEAKFYEALEGLLNRKDDAVASVKAPEVKTSTPETETSSGQEPDVHILLTEDNLINQKVAKRLMEKGGYRVTVANNGQEAVDKVFNEKFDMVFMDIQMPVMDGLDATINIRSREGDNGHIPIIAMTAHAMKGDREKCLAAGMDDYITKPIQKNLLYETIKKYAAQDG